MTTDTVTHIDARLLDLRTGILRTDRTPHPAHHLQVGDIVAHIHHLLILQTILREEGVIRLDLHGTTDVDILNAQPLVAYTHALGLGPREDDDTQPQLHRQLDGIAVLDVHRAQRFALRRHRNRLRAQHPVHIKDNRLYLRQIIVDHLFSKL